MAFVNWWFLNTPKKAPAMNEEKMDLLLAAQVLDLAAAIRKDSWNAYATQHGYDTSANSGAMQTWRAAHSASVFVPQALATLEEVAEQIRSIKASNLQSS